jgi:uncharacterized protein
MFKKILGKINLAIKKIAIILLILYKKLVSPILGQNCRFYPSCSDYAREAIEQYGVLKGIWLACKRLLKCQPWHEGGFDPVPKKNGK